MRCFHSTKNASTHLQGKGERQKWRSSRVKDFQKRGTLRPGFVSHHVLHLASHISHRQLPSSSFLVAALCDLKGPEDAAVISRHIRHTRAPPSQPLRLIAPQRSQQLCLRLGAIHNSARAIKSALLNDNFVRALRRRPLAPRPSPLAPQTRHSTLTFRCYSFVTVIRH